uniref:G-protein coupled receptors family 1 profile domain-containing protein n=1 Tax=Clytia hemisphaerica TaxID=252671 RepID=A0A7M5UKP9_9CNID
MENLTFFRMNLTMITRSQHNLEYFKLRYSCYLKVLNLTSMDILDKVLAAENRTFEIVATVVCFTLAAFIISANSVFIFTLLMTTKRKLTFVQRLFLYVSCIDLIAGFIAMPMMGVSQYHGLTCLQQASMMGAAVFAVVADSCGVLTISCLRYHSILKPMRKISSKRIIFFLVLQILFALACSMLFLFCYVKLGTITMFQVLGHLAGAVVSILNLSILITVFLTLIGIGKLKKTELSLVDETRLRNQHKSTKTLLIIASVMTLSFIMQVPSLIILSQSLAQSSLLSGETFIWTKRNADFSTLVSCLNTGFNSVILICRSKKMRRYIKK